MATPPTGKYVISTEIDSVTYYVGRITNAIGIVTLENAEDLPIFTLDNVGAGEYNIRIGDLLVYEKADGDVCIEQPPVDVPWKKWMIVPSRHGKFMIKGGLDTCWTLAPSALQSPVGRAIMDTPTATTQCTVCPTGCGCSTSSPCAKKSDGCPGCQGSTKPAGTTCTIVANDCSGCPSPCLSFQMTPAPQ